MTLANCERLLDYYKKCMDDDNLSGAEKANAKLSYENMLANYEAKKAKLGIKDSKFKK